MGTFLILLAIYLMVALVFAATQFRSALGYVKQVKKRLVEFKEDEIYLPVERVYVRNVDDLRFLRNLHLKKVPLFAMCWPLCLTSSSSDSTDTSGSS